MVDKAELEKTRAELVTKRDELMQRIDAINADFRRGLDPDFEEQAQQLENAEVLDGIAKAASEELAAVEARLAEIEKALAQ